MPRRTRFLDKQQLPFTAQEIFLAASLVWPSALARKYVEVIARQVRAHVRYLSQRRSLNRRHRYPSHEPVFALELQQEVLAALGVLSATAMTRVNQLMKVHWRHRRRLLIEHERVTAARRMGLLPTSRQIRAIVRKAKLHEASGRKTDRWGGLMIQHPPLPKATPKMIAVADKRVLKEREKWVRLGRRMRLRAGRNTSSGAA